MASGRLYTLPLTSCLTACALNGQLRRVTYKEPDAVCMQLNPPDDEHNVA